jgi:hypothetical protein
MRASESVLPSRFAIWGGARARAKRAQVLWDFQRAGEPVGDWACWSWPLRRVSPPARDFPRPSSSCSMADEDAPNSRHEEEAVRGLEGRGDSGVRIVDQGSDPHSHPDRPVPVPRFSRSSRTTTFHILIVRARRDSMQQCGGHDGAVRRAHERREHCMTKAWLGVGPRHV